MWADLPWEMGAGVGITTGAGAPVLVLPFSPTAAIRGRTSPGHPSASIGNLGSEWGWLTWSGRGRACPRDVGWIYALFLKSQRYFNFVQQESNQSGLTAGTVFHFSCLMGWLRLGFHWRKLGWGQNQTIPVSNSFRSPSSIPATGRARPCSSCSSYTLLTMLKHASYLLMQKEKKNQKEKEKRRKIKGK